METTPILKTSKDIIDLARENDIKALYINIEYID